MLLASVRRFSPTQHTVSFTGVGRGATGCRVDYHKGLNEVMQAGESKKHWASAEIHAALERLPRVFGKLDCTIYCGTKGVKTWHQRVNWCLHAHTEFKKDLKDGLGMKSCPRTVPAQQCHKIETA